MIFVDTSFWIAWTVPRDEHHQDALQLFASLAPQPLVTSNHVRGETWTHLRRKAGHRIGVEVLDRIDRSPLVTVAFIGAELEERAANWLRKHDERAYSFVDATSFALMRSLKVRQALAFDGDFAAAGFVELRPRT
ncbi:MAG: type II toxin-antitoxin system VapC family toxin [Planctomycetaceae bacterium]